jgi:nitrite reductase/ring-hydroxylating ferredoxin subunit
MSALGELMGLNLFFLRVEGEFRGFDNQCSHYGRHERKRMLREDSEAMTHR